MEYAGGEWAMLGVGAGLILLGLILLFTLLALGKRREWSVPDWRGAVIAVSLVVMVIGAVLGGSSTYAATSRHHTLQAIRQVHAQGFIVLGMDLSNSNQHEATLQGPDSCIVHRHVERLPRLGYRVVWNGQIAQPAELSCGDL